MRCSQESGFAGSDWDLSSSVSYPGLVRIRPPERGGPALLCNKEMTDTWWLDTRNTSQLSADMLRVRRSAGLILHCSVSYRGSA